MTTLLEPQRYPVRDIAELYRQRWNVEIYFRHLKQTMRMDVLRCRTLDGVRKELWIFALMYNLVRATMVEASLCKGVPPDRIGFIDTLRWLMQRRFDRTEFDPLVNPGRHQPRAVKRRPKQYSLLTQPRAEMIKAMQAWRL